MGKSFPILIEVDSEFGEEVGRLEQLGVELDTNFNPIQMSSGTRVVRAWAQTDKIEEIRRQRGVVSISDDPRIEPF